MLCTEALRIALETEPVELRDYGEKLQITLRRHHEIRGWSVEMISDRTVIGGGYRVLVRDDGRVIDRENLLGPLVEEGFDETVDPFEETNGGLQKQCDMRVDR